MTSYVNQIVSFTILPMLVRLVVYLRIFRVLKALNTVLSTPTCRNLHKVPKMVRLALIRIYLGRPASRLLEGGGNIIYVKINYSTVQITHLKQKNI
jgi:hypothetical protein